MHCILVLTLYTVAFVNCFFKELKMRDEMRKHTGIQNKSYSSLQKLVFCRKN